MRTAGRTVLFSSLTVAAALASLIVFPQRFLYSMGIGGSLVALFAAAVALVDPAGDPQHARAAGQRARAAIPAAARRARRDRHAQQGFWYRLSRFVMRRPIPIAIVSAAFLIALGIPFLSLKFTSVDAQVLPESASARQVDDVMRADFPPVPRQPDPARDRRAPAAARSTASSPRSSASRESPRWSRRGASRAE